MAFITYAQNFEDVMLWRALKNEKPGTYIDVGACDPDFDSVTRAFYERGWRGINIEPMVDSYNRIVKARPDEINLCIALDNYTGKARFFSIENAVGLATGIETIAEDHHSKHGWNINDVIVPVTTLSDICKMHVSGDIHFLKIDVEGKERQVLEGADFNLFRPWIIVIEATKPMTQELVHEEWDELILHAEYTFVYFDGLNRFYLANEHKERLQSAFISPPNVFDQFIRYSEAQACLSLEEVQSHFVKEKTLFAEEIVSLHNQIQDRRNECAIIVKANMNLINENTALMHAKNNIEDENNFRKSEMVILIENNKILENENGARRDRIEVLSATLEKMREERDSYHQALLESNKHAAILNQERDNLQHSINLLTEDYNAIKTNNDSMNSAYQSLMNAKSALLSSLSWKITAPLRYLKKILMFKR